jgi:hypothetical protein
MRWGMDLTHLSEPLVQGTQLRFTQHPSGSSFTSNGVTTMSPRVHHEKCRVAIVEVITTLSRNPRVLTPFRIVNPERVISFWEGGVSSNWPT